MKIDYIYMLQGEEKSFLLLDFVIELMFSC